MASTALSFIIVICANHHGHLMIFARIITTGHLIIRMEAVLLLRTLMVLLPLLRLFLLLPLLRLLERLLPLTGSTTTNRLILLR